MVTLTVTTTNGCTSIDSLPVIIHPVPVTQFINNTACVNYPIQFIDSGYVANHTDSIAWSSWTFDTTHTFGDTATYTFTSTGNHIVTLTDITYGGCSSTLIDTINVQSSPSANFTFNPPNGSPPLQVTFTNNSIGDSLSYLWTFGDGTGSIYFDPVHTYLDTTCDTIKLIVTDKMSYRKHRKSS